MHQLFLQVHIDMPHVSISVCIGYFLLTTWYELESLRERTSIEGLPPSVWPIGMSVGNFLIVNWCWRAKATEGNATSRQVDQGYVKKLAEKAKERKAVSSGPSRFLLQAPTMGFLDKEWQSVTWIKSSPPQVAFWCWSWYLPPWQKVNWGSMCTKSWSFSASKHFQTRRSWICNQWKVTQTDPSYLKNQDSWNTATLGTWVTARHTFHVPSACLKPSLSGNSISAESY